jgi:protein-tyrosine phosphatase
MIDLHSHILPGVDDGPGDWEGTLGMLRIAEDGGTTTIVATPHSHDYWRAAQPPEILIPRLVAEANQRAADAGLTIKVLPGQECQALPGLVQDLDRMTCQTLAHSRTVLVELPFMMWPPHTESLIFNLQLAGYTVLLAHPERYKAVQEDPSRLAPLIERGVYTQITTTSIMGRNGPKAQELTRQMVELNWAHVLASDAHSTGGRNPRLDEAEAELARWTDDATARRMAFDTPLALLNDQLPDVPEPLPYEPRRKKIFGLF